MSPTSVTGTNTKQNQKEQKLKDTEEKFNRACQQISGLSRQLGQVKTRYSRARADNSKHFRYKLRLKLTVIQGVRDMYCEYARRKAEEIMLRRENMYAELVEEFVAGPGTY